MPTGSGLDAQLGFKAETTWGTAVTVDKFAEFNTESLRFSPTWLEPTGIGAGRKFKRVSRVRQSRKGVAGDVALEWATKGMGVLVKHMLGSSAVATQIAATAAYKQIHTPGDFRGLGLTVQIGRPEPGTGTVRPHTFSGCKVAGWQFALTDNAVPTLTLTLDGRAEDTATALAVASYLAGSSVFDFSQATLKLGGTPSTAAGETTISGGTAVATVVRQISLAGQSPKAVERYGIGNSGLKSEQLENATPMLTGSLAAEFSKAELYDVYQANTTTALQLDLTGAVIEGANSFLLSFILPAVKFKSAAPAVSGPDIVAMSTDIEAYSNETDPPIQIKIVSTDTAL